MSDDKLAFLDRPRDEQGRFAPTNSEPAAPTLPTLESEKPLPQQEPAPQAQPTVDPAAPPQQAEKPEWHIAAVLDEREKRQKLQRELEEIKRKYEEKTAQPARVFDPIADPDGFTRSLEEQRAIDAQNQRLETSWLIAQMQHGEETVAAAEEWVKQELERNPGFFQLAVSQKHPFDFVVKQHKRSLEVAKLGEDDFATAAAKWAEANGYSKQQQQAIAEAAALSPQQRTPLPKPSLANAPSAGGAAPKIPIGPGVAFDRVFKS